MGARNFKLRDEETIYNMMRMYTNYSGMFQDFFDEQTELYNFTVGSLQWDAEVRKVLKAANRPTNSYNLIRTILMVVFSIEKENQKRGKAVPRETGDNKLANVVNEVLDFFLYKSGYTKAQKRVFLDAIIARLGVYHVGWRYEGNEDQSGSLFVDAIDPREIFYESNFNDPLWSKSSFIMRKHSLSIEEILNTFALNDEEMQSELIKEASIFFEKNSKRDRWITQKLKALFSAVYETATGRAETTGDNLFKNYLQWWNPATGKFDILELHEKRTERRLIVNDQMRENKIIDLTDAYQSTYNELEGRAFDGFNFDNNVIQEIKKRYNIDGVVKTDLQKRRFQTIVIPTFNLKVSERPYPFETETYVYIPQYCYDTHADPFKVQSIMDDLKDPQADFNKSKSLILELLGRYANKGWILDENAIVGLEEDWETQAIAPYRRVRAGYINMIRPEQGQTISPELVRMPAEVQQLMKVISNADDEIRGNANPQVTSGRHFIAKEQRQAKSFSYVLDNRDNAQRAVYQLALDFVQHFATTPQIIRIRNNSQPNQQETAVINQSSFEITQEGRIEEIILNDIDAEKYDIEITDEPYSASAQEQRYAKLGDLFNATLAVNQQKADVLLEMMVTLGNFPDSEKILEAWEKLKNPQQTQEQSQIQQLAQQVQQIMTKLEIEGKAADVESKKLDNLKKKAETDKIVQETQDKKVNRNMKVFNTARNILGGPVLDNVSSEVTA